jgi:hypothetical protein
MNKHEPPVLISELLAHCDYLEKTLIPDLKETMPETARDIEYILPFAQWALRYEKLEKEYFERTGLTFEITP